MKTTEGCMELAALKTDLIVFSDSPLHLDSTELGVTASKTIPASAAICALQKFHHRGGTHPEAGTAHLFYEHGLPSARRAHE